MGDRLRDRVAIVTGGAAGLGQSFSSALAGEGARVIVADVNDASETVRRIEQAGGRCFAIEADVAREADVVRLMDRAVAEFGKIDILVNNAGIFPIQPISEMTLADWRRVMSVNLDGTFNCTRAALPHMRRIGHGRIINIASTTYFSNVPIFAHYVSSKGGVIGLTRALAGEVAEFGITINCIAPGLTHSASVAASEFLQGIWDGVVAGQSIKRRQRPEDLSGPLIFFASDDSAFVTGQTLCVDGGGVRH